MRGLIFILLATVVVAAAVVHAASNGVVRGVMEPELKERLEPGSSFGAIHFEHRPQVRAMPPAPTAVVPLLRFQELSCPPKHAQSCCAKKAHKAGCCKKCSGAGKQDKQVVLAGCKSSTDGEACKARAAQAVKRQAAFPPLQSLSLKAVIDSPESLMPAKWAGAIKIFNEEDAKCKSILETGGSRDQCPPSNMPVFLQEDCDMISSVQAFQKCVHPVCQQLRIKCF